MTRMILAALLLIATIASCNTLPPAYVLDDPDLVTLKEMGYLAGFSAAMGGTKDQIREQVDAYAKAQGYAGWKEVAFNAAQDLAANPNMPDRTRRELQTILNMLAFHFPDNEQV